MEYSIVKLDHEAKDARVSLRTEELLKELKRQKILVRVSQIKDRTRRGAKLPSVWQPEHASYMVKSTPGVPYRSFNSVEQNMKDRQKTN